MSRHIRIATLILCFTVLKHGILYAHMPTHISSGQNYEIGDIVDNFTLPSATGDSISLYEYWGKVILIHVWHAG